MATLEEKLAERDRMNKVFRNETFTTDRINSIMKPQLESIPPKAINAFSFGIPPEAVGSGEQVGIVTLGRIKFDTVNGRILLTDENGVDRLLLGFQEDGF